MPRRRTRASLTRARNSRVSPQNSSHGDSDNPPESVVSEIPDVNPSNLIDLNSNSDDRGANVTTNDLGNGAQTPEVKVSNERPAQSMITVGSIVPRDFDGLQDCDDWIEHFTYVSKCNNWDERMQKRRIPIYLKGTAELWYRSFTRMSEDPSVNEDSLSLIEIFAGLRDAFRPKNFRSINQSALICRLQGLNEPVSSYVYDVLRLCHKMSPLMCEEDKLTHVMRGLRSGMLEKVLVLEPKDCQDLLNKLRTIEEAQFLSNQRPGYNLLLVEGESGKSAEKSETVKESGENKNDKMSELCELIKQLLQKRKKPYSESKQRAAKFNKPTRTVDGRVICWHCEVPGHYANSCPRKASTAGQSPPASTEGKDKSDQEN